MIPQVFPLNQVTRKEVDRKSFRPFLERVRKITSGAFTGVEAEVLPLERLILWLIVRI